LNSGGAHSNLRLTTPLRKKTSAEAMWPASWRHRFQMKSHWENRPVNTWVLTAVKPKLRPADAASRTKWTEGSAPGAGRLMNCHNMTMAEFAALLPYIAQGSATVAVLDETGLQGSWDFSFTFNGYGFDVAGPMVGRGGDAAPDPSATVSLKEALSKLGLKLELQKRPMPVLAIDHMEPKPTEN
jgi:uncharacterized protein (TIGR03435 family)